MTAKPSKPRSPEPSVKTDSLVDYVVESIILQVSKGRLVPGQRLIASDLAEALNVSRAPVREALHVLAGEGVVSLIPNRGAIISQRSPKELMDFLEFTSVICALGLRRAAPQMHKAENRATVEQAYERIEECWELRDASRFIASLYEFHKAVNEISGNAFLELFYSRPYFTFYNRLLADFIPGTRWDEYLEHYKHLTAVLLGEQAADTAKEFEVHMQWASDLLQENAERGTTLE